MTVGARVFAKPGTHNCPADVVVLHPRQLLPGYIVISRELEDFLSISAFALPPLSPDRLFEVFSEILREDKHVKMALGPDAILTAFQAAPLRFGPLSRCYDRQLLVVGDAAGHWDPLTGQGIANALLGGKIAAQTLVEAFAAANLSASFLSRFQQRIDAAFGKDLRMSVYLTRITAKFPIFIDAIASSIKRSASEQQMIQLWTSVRHGIRSKMLFLRPDIGAMLITEIIFSWLRQQFGTFFHQTSNTASAASQQVSIFLRRGGFYGQTYRRYLRRNRSLSGSQRSSAASRSSSSLSHAVVSRKDEDILPGESIASPKELAAIHSSEENMTSLFRSPSTTTFYLSESS